MKLRRALLIIFVLGAAGRSIAQTQIPELRYTDPPGFYRSAIYPPSDYSSQEVNASLQVYPFRPINGDIRQAFAHTLLREIIDPRYQETNVAPGVRIDQITMPGADTVLRAFFQEANFGPPRLRMRMAIVVGKAVAVLDVSASSMESWQRVSPQLNAFFTTLNITSGKQEPVSVTSVGPVGRAVAGLYMGFKNRFVALPGYSRYVWSAYYYLFSPDGRVYRAYDELPVPGNDPARFDFNAARRADPENSGQYSIRDNTILLRIGSGPQPESYQIALPTGSVIRIGGVEYERQ